MKCRKLLAILLALVMVIGLLPFAALADGSQDNQPGYTQGADPTGDGNPEPEPEPAGHTHPDAPFATWTLWDGTVKDNNGQKYLDSGYYYLENSLDIASIGKTINIQGDVHLCLNDQTLSGNTPRYGIFQINPDSSLTICDCKGGGVLRQNGGADEAILVTGGTFTLCGGTINAGTSKYAVRVNVYNDPAILNIEGGCITSSNRSGIYGGTSGTANADINVNGGRIEGASGIDVVGDKPNTEITVNGGEIVGTSSTGIQISKGKITVNNGSISGATGLKTFIIKGNGEVCILGGSITGTVDYGVLLYGNVSVQDAYAPVYLSGTPTIEGEVADIDLYDAKCRLHASYDGREYSGKKLEIRCEGHSLGNTVVYDTVNTDLFGVIEGYLVPGSNNLILSDQEPTPPVEGHKHAADGTVGSEIWTEWDGQSDLNTGCYYLKDNVDISEILAENNLPLHITGDVHLCLNGKTLEGSAETLAALIEISTGASLTICDCGEGGTLKRTKASVTSSRGCVIDNSSGTLILYDGTIQNDANDRTYAVTVSSSNGAASFEMYQDATIRSIGTGIRLYGGSNATTATIHGGTIEYAGASGISVEKDFKNSTLTIENISIDPGTSGEQGLYILSGTVNIQDGNIRGKQYGAKIYTAQNNGETHISGGTLHGDAYGIEITLPFGENTCAPVYLSNAPTIDGNTADIHYVKNTSMLYAKDGENAYSGDNLSISCPSFVDGDVVVYEGSELQGKFSVVEEGKSLVVKGDNLVLGNEAAGHQNHGINGSGEGEGTWTAWDPRTTKTLDGGYYYLDKNYDNLEAITVTGDVHLCLNGHEMSDNDGRNAQFIIVNKDAYLTICDCSENETGKINHNYNAFSGYAIRNNGTLTLYSGGIYSEGGNGIHIATIDGSDVKFDMEGGTIDVDGIGILFNIGKKEVDKVNINGGTLTYGGKTGVLFGAEGTLTVSGGTIQPRENGASNSQGISRTSAGDLYVTDGEISGEQCGIQITTAGGGEVKISGGNISASGDTGYGIYLSETATATANLYLSNDPTILGKKADLYIGKPNAVYAGKETAYYGSVLDIYYAGGAETEDPIIRNVTEDNANSFNLNYPTNKTLEHRSNNLYLADKNPSAEVDTAPTAVENLVYNGAAQALVTAGTATGGTMVYSLSENGTYTEAIPEGTNAGDYTVWYKVQGDGNHIDTDPQSISVSIDKADPIVTAPTAVQNLVYNGTAQTLVTPGTATGGTMVYSLDGQDYDDAVPTATNAGTYTVWYKVQGDDNHNDTDPQSISVSIDKANLTVKAPAAVQNLVYNGAAQTLVTPGTATGGTMVYSLDGQDYDDAVPTGINAGDYTVWYKVQGDGNYSDTAPVEIKVSIGKADLTVTADNKQIYEGSPVPTYTASYSGFVNNETKDVLSGELKFTCDYTTSSEPDTYDIEPSGLTSTNYDIEFKNGTLTVVAVGEILPPVAKDLTYTGKAQKLIDPATAKDDVDLFYSLDGSHFYSTIPEAKNAGTYTVYWKAEKDSTTVDNGSLTVIIKKASLTVKANDIWVYAGSKPEFTATIKGYVNGEDWSELGGKLTFTCDYSEKYSKPGSRYPITLKGLTADNYEITFKPGILTVKDPLSPRFNVYVLDSKHGTVEADCRYARKGDVVTLTIKPDWGYELETLTVTDSHGYELKLTYHSNGTYTFTMPRDNVTVKAIFTVRDMPFVDVPGDAWYAGGVRYVYAHGLMNGTGSWRFSPNRTTTRAMIATILYRMEGSPRVYGTSQFGDVEAGSWYEDAVIWATQNDIVEGYTSKTFGPNDPITREQMAAMLYRYADYCRCDMSAGRYVDLSKFSDMNEISDYAIPALRWAVGEEIIQGRTGKRLAPTDTATRAEVAVMLMRFCEEVIW